MHARRLAKMQVHAKFDEWKSTGAALPMSAHVLAAELQ